MLINTYMEYQGVMVMDDRIPVLIVTHSLGRGGTEQHLLQVMKRLDKKRFIPKVLPLYRYGELIDDFVETQLLVGPAKASRVRALGWLAHACVKSSPIVHFFLPEPYLLGAPVAKACGAASIVMSRRNRNHYQTKHAVAGLFERFLHKWTSVFIGNSLAVVNDLLAEGARPEKIHMIYNGVDSNGIPAGAERAKMRQRLRNRLGISEQTFLLVCVANLFPYKGHRDLLLALQKLDPELRENVALLVVGRDEGILDSLKLLATQLCILDKVHFLGESNEVRSLLIASDIGVLASHEEGFSNAVLETMAAGLPMVVTDVGGNAEAIIHGVCGYVVPARDPAALSKALASLIVDSVSRHAMGDAARRRAVETFSLDSCVGAYEELYTKIWCHRFKRISRG